MVANFFFASRLDPILDGGKRDEDAMIAPKVPTGTLIGQAILGNQTDGQLLNATGVKGLGQSQIGQVDTEVAVTVGTVMLGIGDNKVDGVAGARVPQVMQGA
jgi:hypothetical protein